MSIVRTDVQSPVASENDAKYVLPNPGRPVSGLVLPASRSKGPRYRESEVARSIGQRAVALLECQARLLDELRGSLQEFESDLGEATRARLQAKARVAVSVLEWCDAVQADLQQEASWAANGLQPVDLMSFCRDQAGIAAADGVAVNVIGERNLPWWGDAARLGTTLAAAITLVRSRAGSSEAVVLEIRGDRDTASLRVAGIGETAEIRDPAIVEDFRANAELLGCKVVPDDLGPGSNGLILMLPSA
ncbi:MAG: hypothetical protein KDC98_07350 [Planctomycetes bacterium]|nr:hypothetical protein [Planctomycetota bacterium]